MHPSNIPGYGFDADPAKRPGVPKISRPPDAEFARTPTQQQGEPAVRTDSRTPVFGTAQPPHGLSGALRQYAYQTPPHQPRHWLTLMLADRVDVWEHRLENRALLVAIGAVAVGGAVAISLGLRRR